MLRLKYFLPVLVFAALGIFMYIGLHLNSRELPSVLINKPLPNFQLEEVRTNTLVSKDDLPEGPFLLNVWGSYCLPCLVEHPTFMRLSEDGVIPIVGINYKDRQGAAQDWLDTNGNPFQFSVMDEDGRLGIDLGVYGAPETFLIDKNGLIRYRHVSVLDEQAWQEIFVPAIEELQREES
ncbi:MAG: DsbE family thiol:disulfide interchange protein [Gammaproteobacteria bacterium]|nr:DsbE family thiol:disulfide interchange protein [Pseudomonadales bacterium]MCP5345856.1 DsbE family thiol:disulfide interchange protein [Pseudomonadales bacterium]